jgi:hypothetical protein
MAVRLTGALRQRADGQKHLKWTGAALLLPRALIC